MSEERQPWTIERIHKEVSEARTRMFVVTKVLETGDIDPAQSPEWALIIRPLLKDIIENAQRVSQMIDKEKPATP